MDNLTEKGTHTVYCVVSNSAGSATSRIATLTCSKSKPTYTYTGSHTLIDDGDGNWRIKFLSSGTLNVSDVGATDSIDVFLVGGGGGGAGFYDNGYWGGGGGGYTSTSTTQISVGLDYPIVIGAGGTAGNWTLIDVTDGGTTSAFGFSVAGGSKGRNGSAYKNGRGGGGGSGGGGSGANGGTNGGDGGYGVASGGTGQGTTTREFGEESGTLYAGGGAGGDNGTTRTGGAGGGGNSGYPGETNTGGGGGGGDYDHGQKQNGQGGSGIVVIRNHR